MDKREQLYIGTNSYENTVIYSEITVFGTPGETRTHYLALRRRTLYPGELRGHIDLIALKEMRIKPQVPSPEPRQIHQPRYFTEKSQLCQHLVLYWDGKVQKNPVIPLYRIVPFGYNILAKLKLQEMRDQIHEY